MNYNRHVEITTDLAVATVNFKTKRETAGDFDEGKYNFQPQAFMISKAAGGVEPLAFKTVGNNTEALLQFEPNIIHHGILLAEINKTGSTTEKLVIFGNTY